MSNNKESLERIIKGIQNNQILKVFEEFYHDEIVMYENGDSSNRVGKAANRKAEESFVNNATINEARVLKTIVDGDNTAYEMYMDFTYGGHPVKKTQWAFQQWSNGKIIKEEFVDVKKPPTPEPSKNVESNLQAIIKGIQQGKILEVFEKYYHNDVIMYEKGDSSNRVGKAANRKAEESFVNNATINEAKLLKVLVDGDNTAYEMYMDFTYGGHPVKKTQWAVQQWSNDLVIKEEFY
ncbi:hypothetical protein DDB_G0281999 [Dictyostelium discoideum AX4]|uniref:SnoaL-like domain-containing protein n=1 Tax=Dictyostelium discoideum TaxID=44689 RepID=Q54T52_DICDI|nr:hypothetical protein DDB_G0281999 [Dictyostelium discoideum AX4]EAL66421.1 hypothetical protein DDB_G0281999 [Dictyostelium discoideum AX4]|eukprot:XP_640399.1 hypothetical protein DDB_G0281999 [Dictyostelium discoideum AX4]